MVFYIAHLETANFEFYAYAETPELARELMAKQWNKHRKATGAILTAKDVASWVNVYPMEMNSAHRRG